MQDGGGTGLFGWVKCFGMMDVDELKVLQKDYCQLWQQEQLVVLEEVELERYFLAGSL